MLGHPWSSLSASPGHVQCPVATPGGSLYPLKTPAALPAVSTEPSSTEPSLGLVGPCPSLGGHPQKRHMSALRLEKQLGWGPGSVPSGH